MKSRVAGLAALLFCCATASYGQTAPLKLEISGGVVTLHAQNVPLRSILAEWARLGGATIVNGDRIVGSPLTLELTGVPERQALDIVLRGVAGFMLAAREPGTSGASMYDRIMILPTSVAPRNPPPTASPVFNGMPAGIIRPMPREDDQDMVETADQGNDGVPLGRPIPMPIQRPAGVPFPPAPVNVGPDVDYPQQQPGPAGMGVVPTPSNPFGLPAGSSMRPGVITPVPQAPPSPQQIPPGPGQD